MQNQNRKMESSLAACALELDCLASDTGPAAHLARGQVPQPPCTSILSDIECVITRALPLESCEHHTKYIKHLARCLVYSNPPINDCCYYSGEEYELKGVPWGAESRWWCGKTRS